MTVANAVDPYGTAGRIIHWSTAALVIVLIGMGKVAHIEAATGNWMYWWHSSLGVLVLLLAVARIVWRLVSTRPVVPELTSGVERWAARIVHVLFYALLIFVPLSGWLLASVEAAGVSFFGLSLPMFAAGTGEAREEFFEELHEVLGNVLLILVVVHVLAALKHHFIDRDTILRRMIPVLRK